jgi:hypothetical protein
MEDKARIDELITYQEQWIRQLQDTKEQLVKYRDGTLPYIPKQIDNIVNAQKELARAVKNIAECIRKGVR